MKRAKDLALEEANLHKTLDEGIRHVLSSKRLLLFRETLHDAGVEDENLFKDICVGFRLVGNIEPSGQFQTQWKPSALGVEQLKQTALWAQHAVVGECKKIAADPEIAQAVWEETLEQAASDKR